MKKRWSFKLSVPGIAVSFLFGVMNWGTIKLLEHLSRKIHLFNFAAFSFFGIATSFLVAPALIKGVLDVRHRFSEEINATRLTAMLISTQAFTAIFYSVTTLIDQPELQPNWITFVKSVILVVIGLLPAFTVPSFFRKHLS